MIETLALDTTDRALIALLQANARASHTELSERLHVARSTVVARMKRLESAGVVSGYTAKLALHGPGQGIEAHVCLNVEPKAGREVERAVRGMPQVRQLLAVSGPYDYVAVLHAASPAQLNALLDELGHVGGVTKTMSLIVLANKVDRSA